MNANASISVRVSHNADGTATCRAAARLAADIGFAPRQCEEIALAAKELVTNLVRHAGEGLLTVSVLELDGRSGIQIEAIDTGPGIEDVDRAMADGFSTAGSLGCGLGTVNRCMDELYVSSRRQGVDGTRVVCRRWLRRLDSAAESLPLDIGAATRAHPRMTHNGDAFVIKRWSEGALAGVIDGLGHGQFAHRAAEKARQYIENHCDRPLADLFLGVQRECRATRGVVMALARFGTTSGERRPGGHVLNPGPPMTLTFASVGNIETRLFFGAEPARFVIRRGVVGMNAPKPLVTHHPWAADGILVLHSDGLGSHWHWRDFPELQSLSATAAAQGLLRKLAKDTDDASVLVVRRPPDAKGQT